MLRVILWPWDHQGPHMWVTDWSLPRPQQGRSGGHIPLAYLGKRTSQFRSSRL